MDSCALVQSSRFSTTDWWSWCITELAFPMRISNLLFCLLSLVNETPRYLNFSDCFIGNSSRRREQSFSCLDRNMVFVFVVLIFIPATEHAFENLSRACWRPFWVKSSSTRSFANYRRSLYGVITRLYSATRLTFLNYLYTDKSVVRQNRDASAT